MDHRSGPALALSCSIAAHALAIALWQTSATRETRKPAPASAGRAIVVRLHAAGAPSPATQAPGATPPAAIESPLPAAQRAVRKRAVLAERQAVPVPPASAVPREAPAAAALAAAAASAPVLPERAAPTAPAEASSFAGLFAPLVTRAMGRSGWARSAAARPAPEAPAPVPPDLALATLRMALLERLASLGRGIAADAHALHCDIAVDGKRRLAQIQCADPADRAAPWGALHELLAAGPVTTQEADLCFTLRPAEAAAIACAAIEPVADR